MARFAYLKSCYERFRSTFSHITQVIAQDSINHYLKRSKEILVERDHKEALKLSHSIGYVCIEYLCSQLVVWHTRGSAHAYALIYSC